MSVRSPSLYYRIIRLIDSIDSKRKGIIDCYNSSSIVKLQRLRNEVFKPLPVASLNTFF